MPAHEFLRTGVLRIFQKSCRKAFICLGLLISQHSGDEPGYCVDNGQSSELTARENVALALEVAGKGGIFKMSQGKTAKST